MGTAYFPLFRHPARAAFFAGSVPGRRFFINGTCGFAGFGKTCPGGRAELQAEKGRVQPSQAARALGAFFAFLTRPQAGQTRASGGDTAPAQ